MKKDQFQELFCFYKKNETAKLIIKRNCIDLYDKFVFLEESDTKNEEFKETKENGDKLTTLEVHDIVCHIADAVLAGGIRRAALISLFSADDDSMISSKYGNWWETNPQRGRANNSAALVRSKITEEFFFE